MITQMLLGTGARPFDVILTHTDAVTDPSSTTITFTDCDLGDPDSSRWIYFCLGIEANGDPVSGTINGVAWSQVSYSGRNTSPTPDTACGIYRALVPSGSIGDIVINVSAATASNSYGITVFAVYGSAGTIYDTDQSNNSSTRTIDIPPNGVGLYVISANSVNTAVWTNATAQSNITMNADTVSSAIRENATGSVDTTAVSSSIGNTIASASFNKD